MKTFFEMRLKGCCVVRVVSYLRLCSSLSRLRLRHHRSSGRRNVSKEKQPAATEHSFQFQTIFRSCYTQKHKHYMDLPHLGPEEDVFIKHNNNSQQQQELNLSIDMVG